MIPRLRAALARWWRANICATVDEHGRYDVYGTDDDLHLDPNGCACPACSHALDVIRRALLAEADLADCRAIAALPMFEGADE